MKGAITRRNALAVAAGALTAPAALPITANAAASLVGIEWGGPLIEATKKVSAGYTAADVTWELHSGGAGTVLPKIKSAWPKPKYDIVAAWNPIFLTMINEGWLEPLTFDEIPNLRDMPPHYILKDNNGAMVTVPRSLAGMFWGYRADTAPVKIETIEHLFDRRLKGQICWPGPSINSNLQVLSLALSGGGNERNMEPGWEILKKLARSGNIGRVANTETDFISSISTGETSVAFWNMAPWKKLATNFEIAAITRASDEKGMKAFLYQDGWVILKSSQNKKAVKEYLNAFISPENNTMFNKMLGQAPTNVKSKTSGFAANINFAEDELAKFAYFPDFSLLAQQLNDSVNRFETEIAPIL